MDSPQVESSSCAFDEINGRRRTKQLLLFLFQLISFLLAVGAGVVYYERNMSQLRQIKEKFNSLSPEEKETLLSDLYHFSTDTRLFLESRLLGTGGREFIQLMEKETIGKVYRKGMPGTPNGKKVNSIIVKAKKSRVALSVMLQLEKLAYCGFIEFLNEYGGGPENFDEMACEHVEAYLMLAKNHVENSTERNRIFEELKEYLIEKDNLFTDSLDDTYERVVGIKVNRKW